jgi:hybrid cluster-associated redox disulfide protein
MSFNKLKGEKTMSISKKANIIDVINDYPAAIEILKNHGVHCVGCMLAHSESLEEGLAAHGLDVDEIIKEIEQAS